jgi:hypothetical protein
MSSGFDVQYIMTAVKEFLERTVSVTAPTDSPKWLSVKLYVILLVICIVLTLACIGIVFSLCISAIADGASTQSKDLNTLVNIDDFNYHVVKSAQYPFSNAKSTTYFESASNLWQAIGDALFKSKYPFVWVFLLSIISLLVGVFILIHVVNGYRPVGMAAWIVILVVACQNVLTVAVGLPIFMMTHTKLNVVEQQISAYNKFVFNNMYKKVEFLRVLSHTATSVSDMDSTIVNALAAIPADANEADVARALFTINLWANMYSMGFKSTNIDAAIALFNPGTSAGLISESMFTPSDFLMRDGVFIEDHSINYMESLKTRVVQLQNFTAQQRCVTTVAITTAKANNLANVIDTSQAVNPFVYMAFYLLVIQLAIPLVIIVIMKFAIKPSDLGKDDGTNTVPVPVSPVALQPGQPEIHVNVKAQ